MLVFNAAKSCPTMPALFSDHTFRHYAYLRDSLSHLVPPLRVSSTQNETNCHITAVNVQHNEQNYTSLFKDSQSLLWFSCLLVAWQRSGCGGLALRFWFCGISSAVPPTESDQSQYHPEPGGTRSPRPAGLHNTVMRHIDCGLLCWCPDVLTDFRGGGSCF